MNNKHRFLSVPLLLALFSSSSQAIMVNDQTYRMLGGDPDTFMTDSLDTIQKVYSPLHEESFQDQFLGVVSDAGTGTWIGKDSQGYDVFMMAAHTALTGTYGFTDWQGNRPLGEIVSRSTHPNADIAILHVDMGSEFSIKDKKGNPIQPPILYDGNQEVGHTVSMVGYGHWGAGKLSNSRNAGRNDMERRAWGQTIVGSSNGLYMNLPYDTQSDSIQWGKSRGGDSGMSYWQRFNGFWTISGVHSASGGANGTLTVGIRVSAVKDWINDVYPEAKWFSDITPDELQNKTEI